jgi:CRP/FNR family transcriptional regulator, cyclic AMP receptor protein
MSDPPLTPSAARVLELLGQHRILRHLPQTELQALVRGAQLQKYLDRDPIFAQGDEGQSVLAVVEGFVKLSSSTAGGREVVLEIAGPGNVFGELSVLNGWPRAADAQALSVVRLLAIEGKAFLRALERTPAALFEVTHVLSERLRRATEQFTDGVDLPAAARLAKALTQLAGLHSHPGPDGLHIDLNLSQRELGGMTGLTRESINKHLATWRDSGWVRLSERGIVLINPRALRDLVPVDPVVTVG